MSDDAPRAPRNITKALVRFEEHDGKAVVIKDYSSRPWLVRLLYGRPTLRREARAYQRLDGVPGIPRCWGFRSPDALVIERAAGTPLDRLKGVVLPAEIFDALDAVIAACHARGVAIADLHRSNVIVDDAGGVHVIDFALARIAPRPSRPGALVRALFALDQHAAARLRARFLGLSEPEPRGYGAMIYRLGRVVKRLAQRIAPR